MGTEEEGQPRNVKNEVKELAEKNGMVYQDSDYKVDFGSLKSLDENTRFAVNELAEWIEYPTITDNFASREERNSAFKSKLSPEQNAVYQKNKLATVHDLTTRIRNVLAWEDDELTSNDSFNALQAFDQNTPWSPFNTANYESMELGEEVSGDGFQSTLVYDGLTTDQKLEFARRYEGLVYDFLTSVKVKVIKSEH